MGIVLDYQLIDIHVHVTPWEMLNPAAAAALTAMQPNHALLRETVVYEKCIEYDVPLIVHTGTSMFKGARNRFADPMHVDDVAVDFPDLRIIIAHAGRPLHTDSAFFLLRRHPNLYCDLSSVPPKTLLRYYPWLERAADKAMFGSDWPAGARDIGQNIRQFLSLDLSDEVKKKILRDNALRVFKLAER